MKFSNKVALLFLFFIILAGFVFRLKGIVTNHSFWQDEAFVSILARDMTLGKRSFLDTLVIFNHQVLHLLTTSLSFLLLGFSEFSARIPSVLFGTLGILGAFLLASSVSNIYGGLLGAFVFSFAQINIAYATQAKPYSAIQTLLLFEFYVVSLLEKAKKPPIYLFIILFVLALISSLFHTIGLLSWIPIFVFLIRNIRFLKKNLLLNSRAGKVILLTGSILGIVILVIGIQRFIQSNGANVFFSYNHMTYLRELFWKQYALFSLPAFMGVLLIFSSYRGIFLSVIFYSLIILYLWTFKHSTHNIRYLVPFFGILFVFFSVFWVRVGDTMFNKKTHLVAIILALFLFAGGYKIARKPATFYNPNADFYGDVQIADYKTFFSTIKDRLKDTSNIFVVSNWYDAHYWYWPEHSPDAYFMVYTKKPYRHWLTNKMVYGRLEDFINITKNHPKGLLIVEDWESILPDEIRQYAKKNLKLELRVEGLKEAKDDIWPIEAYSWGLD